MGGAGGGRPPRAGPGRDLTGAWAFTTPALERDQSYHYTVRARWMKDGKPVEETQRVQVSAGARVTVTFPKPKS